MSSACASGFLNGRSPNPQDGLRAADSPERSPARVSRSSYWDSTSWWNSA